MVQAILGNVGDADPAQGRGVALHRQALFSSAYTISPD